MDNETISGRCRNIRKQLTDLLTALENGSAQVSTTVTSSSIKDVVERFMLWAGNLGALRKSASKLSLDSRLVSSADLRDYICTELEDMSEAIEDLMNIVNGSMPNREIGCGSGSENDLGMESDESSYSDDPIDEAGSILQVISQGITSLLKIGILVRQPASSGTDRFHRASRDSTSAFLDRFDIDYVQQKHPKLGAGEQSSRIGKTIAKRRQYIRYCRDHKQNLAAEEDEGKIGSQKATTAKQSSKATTFVGKENLMDILQGSVEEDDDAVSHCSVSTTSESLAILKLPRLADLSPEDEPFECPICYTHQQFRSEQAWRRHAYRDLKAYVCTVGGTECDDKFFDDRTSWFNHELEQHRCSYVCVLCGVNDGQKKTTRSLLRRHILKAHGEFESDQLERLEDAGRDTTKIFKSNDCPFCDEWSELIAKKKSPGGMAQSGGNFVVSTSRFKKHVAMHLEQLAIFALPRHELDTGMDEDESQGSDPREMDSHSSASVALSIGSENERVIGDQAPSVGEGPKGVIDQFQFQVPDDAFATPVHATPARPLTPQVYTVPEPDFSPPKRRQVIRQLTDEKLEIRERVTRRDSFEIHQRQEGIRRSRNASEQPSKDAEEATGPKTDKETLMAEEPDRQPSPPPHPQQPQVVKDPAIEGEVIEDPAIVWEVPSLPDSDIDNGEISVRPPSRPPAQVRDKQPQVFEPEIDSYISRKDTEIDIHGHASQRRDRSQERRSPRHTYDDDILIHADTGPSRRLSVNVERRKEEEKKAEEERKRKQTEEEAAVARWKAKEAERLAKEAEEKERIEEEYQRRLHEDLINSGLDEKAIAAILEKEKIKKGKKGSDSDSDCEEDEKQGQIARPTYTRISLRHLDVETLSYFQIDFEYDTEPDYVLIKRWVPEWEQQQLWEHTRQIRTAVTREVSETLVIKDKSRQSNSSHQQDDDIGEWVRKKSSTRHRSKSPSLLMYLAGGRPS